jgi:hypothetical protein
MSADGPGEGRAERRASLAERLAEIAAAPGNCPACGHLWTLHGADGCHGKVYPAHSLAGEWCPCEHDRADAGALGHVAAPGTFYGVSGEQLTASHDEDGVLIRADFSATKLSALGARQLAAHLVRLADAADAWMREAARP